MRNMFAGVLVMVLCGVASADEFKVGAAIVSITPEPGTPMAGYYTRRASEGQLDPLNARCLVIDRDGVKVALIACDLISMPRNVVDEARKLIETQTEIPGANVMISATHTHTGPVLLGRSVRDTAIANDSDAAQAYIARLPRLIAQSAKDANAKLASGKLSVGLGREENLSFNRRYFMSDNTVGWNPGKLNPKIVKPAGPIDPDVPVIYAETADGAPIATYVNFAMHLDTVGGLRLSADYVYELSELLSRIKTREMVTLFTIGCAGDINHVNVKSPDPQKGPAEARRIGTVLAGEVLKTYARLQPVPAAPIRVKTARLELPLAPITAQDIAAAEDVVAKLKTATVPFLQQVKAFKVLDVQARQGKPLEVEVQVIAIGDDLAIVSLPGEIFVELGLDIKKVSPFKHTILAELANGAVGYIPTKAAFDQGNYEPISARCAAGSGEMIAQAAMKLLKELKGE